MPIPWSKLPQTVTRQRPQESESALGEAVLNWTVPANQQAIACNVQQGWNGIKYETEGMSPACLFTMFCNFTTDSTGATLTDVQEAMGDRIVDGDGFHYRVIEARDAAGVGDHFEIRLYRILPGGDA